MSHFSTPKTYVFKNVNDTLNLAYWKMYYKIENQDTMFYTNVSSADMKTTEIFKEKINTDSSTLNEYLLVSYDSLQSEIINKVNVINNDVFIFATNDSTIEWKININDKNISSYLSKKRTLVDTTNLTYGNIEYECLVYKDDFLYKVPSYNINDKFSQLSYYAKGLGLIRYTRTLPTGKVLDFKLNKINNE